jgi:hypothetical protein
MDYRREELRKMGAELQRSINHASLTVAPLDSDVTEAGKRWRAESKQTPSQFWGRIAIRCFCAAVEARLFTLRKMAEQMAVLYGIQFTSEETDILAEQRTVTGDNGVQTVRPKWLPFPDSLKESFRLFAKPVGTVVTLDYGPGGFSDLCSTFQVRNRLMHPKQPFDVEVKAEDMKAADRGMEWFNRAIADLLGECQTVIRKRIATLTTPKGG